MTTASGNLYLDDGKTHDYQSDENASAYIRYQFADNYLRCFDKGTSALNYQYGENQYISQIVVYGLGAEPSVVLVADIEAEYFYDVTHDALIVADI